MRAFGKTSTKPNYLFGLLPQYFKENDTYVPNSVVGHTTEGLLERYLGMFGEELDENLSPYIDDMGLLYDAVAMSGLPGTDPLKFLDYIAEMMGNPSNIGTEAQYQKLLRYIKYIFQTKGTLQSVDYFLRIYGYKVHSVTETSVQAMKYDATPTPLAYDEGSKYDFGFTFYSGWSLVITDIPGKTPYNPGGVWMTNQLKPALQKFIVPIFATINTITYST